MEGNVSVTHPTKFVNDKYQISIEFSPNEIIFLVLYNFYYVRVYEYYGNLSG